MDNGSILTLARDHPDMTDVDRLVNIYHLLSQTLVFGVPGAVAELGCHAGATTVLMRMIIDHFDAERPLHVFDSFCGLPAPGPKDAYLGEGDCRASEDDLRATFARWSKALPIIHKGWFAETLPHALPDTIAFAYIDADLYDSTLTALTHVYPRLAPNGILCIDDYADPERNPQAWTGLPGVKRACDEFFDGRGDRVSVLVGTGDLAFGMIRKGSA